MSYTKHRVKIQACNGWLRLYWRESGKPKYLSLGLPEGDRFGLVIAKKKAAFLEADLLSDNLDPTLNKYRIEEKRTDCISAAALLHNFQKHRESKLDTATANKYRIIANQLQQVFEELRADELDIHKAKKFRQFLLTRQKSITVRDRLFVLKACWEWGVQQGAVKENPWVEALSDHEVPPQQRPKPFTQQEASRIIEAFRKHRHFYLYADYVEFMLLCGFRPAEAIGLRWQHLNDNCRVAWIGQTIVRGRQKAPKTGEPRYFAIPERLAQKLSDRRGELNDLVFPSPKGGAINDNNFCKRNWKPILESLNIPYRKPYTMRSTAISHWLESGGKPIQVAEATGHDVKTLLKYYAGSVGHLTPPPDFLRPLEEGD